MKKLLAALPLLLMISACDQAPQSTDTSALEARSVAWETAMKASDIDALIEIYSSDARLLPPNREMATGAEAVRQVFGDIIIAGMNVELATVEVMVNGDVGHKVGTFTISVDDKLVDVGKYMEIWHRGSDGEWRITNDIFNSDGTVAPEDAPTTHIMITHEVDDAELWMNAWRGKNSRHKLFEDNGAAHVHTFLSADDPNLSGLVVAVTDIDVLNAMIVSEEGVAAAAADGVRADTIKTLTEAK